MERQQHWDEVYHKPTSKLSWHQGHPTTSLQLITAIVPPPARVIDVGGGSSSLAGALLGAGYPGVSVLDISQIAIEQAKERIGPLSAEIRWIVGDVTTIENLGEYDVWHDRAVFHFLTSPEDRAAYCKVLHGSIRRGGHLIIATFGLEGPEQCSGLPVCRYGPESLRDAFGADFVVIRDLTEDHVTPWGQTQQFYYAVFQRQQ
jgi:SAM-dependent methyltransferase